MLASRSIAEQNMSDEIRSMIHNELENKETDELIKIWTMNDRYSWTDETFEVIKGILLERHVEIPVQAPPIFTEKEKEKVILQEHRKNKQPAYYNPESIYRLGKWINIISYIYLVVSVIGNLYTYRIIDYFNTLTAGEYLVQVAIVLTVFICIRAIPKLLMLLMEIEFNTRGKK